MKKKLTISLVLIFVLLIIFYFYTKSISINLKESYKTRQSEIIYDRNHEIIKILPNEDEFYSKYLNKIPKDFEELVLKKEDRYFYWHLGVNPISTFRALFRKIFFYENHPSSTINQQLVKILLNHEKERTIKNKAQEIFYALALELHTDKAKILEMYANSIYLGNQTQGIEMGARLYFGKTPEKLTKSELVELLATISSPSNRNPFLTEINEVKSLELAKTLEIENIKITQLSKQEIKNNKEKYSQYLSSNTYFEIDNMGYACENTCNLKVDTKLTEKIREIVDQKLIPLSEKNVKHAAVVVIKIPENELLAIVGTPDPFSTLSGDQFNMAVETRPIGSTIKPFIYAEAFLNGARPYTLIEDREYKYSTAEGYAHYPKNYDYKYHGIVTLHESLSNSLNVPAVKTLEFVGLEKFYDFLLRKLEITPIQPLETYQYGIALGHLEMTLLELSYYFTTFPNHGYLKPLKISSSKEPYFKQEKQIFPENIVQLINIIITDRDRAADQFGMVGNLRIPGRKVAVKTGTSRAYHDSWTVGYTEDFLVAVWVGNAENTPMKDVSGQVGAGLIWHDVVMLLLDSEYNNQTQFSYDKLKKFYIDGSLEYGLPTDKIEDHRNLMMEDALILSPHNKDIFLFEKNMQILLKSKKEVKWYIDNELVKTSKKYLFFPQSPGTYVIKAEGQNSELEEITIQVQD